VLRAPAFITIMLGIRTIISFSALLMDVAYRLESIRNLNQRLKNNDTKCEHGAKNHTVHAKNNKRRKNG